MRTIFKIEGARTLNVEFQSLWKRAWMGVDYALNRRGPLTMAPSQLGIFAKSSPEYATANVEFHVQPLSLDKFGDPCTNSRRSRLASATCVLRAAAGSMRQRRSRDAPRIQPNYLQRRRGQARRRRLDPAGAKNRHGAGAAKISPAANICPAPKCNRTTSSRAPRATIGTTIFHPIGTAKMGRDDDPNAVVDAQAKAASALAGCRIADASVMPRITSGNTNSPTLMIAEKAAEMILADAKG